MDHLGRIEKYVEEEKWFSRIGRADADRCKSLPINISISESGKWFFVVNFS